MSIKKAVSGAFMFVITLLLSSFTMPEGWFKSGLTPENYEMGIDPHVGQNGSNAATIKSVSSKVKGWATMMQESRADKFLGKKIRMTAFMKTKHLQNKANFWLRVNQAGSDTPLAFDNMMKRPITGATDWTKYEIVLDVPSNASKISFGAMLVGGGQIWFDNLTFEIVDNNTPVSGEKYVPVNEVPSNLDFEK